MASYRVSPPLWHWPVHLLDRARVLWLRALGPLGRWLVRDREARVGVAGALAISVALAATLAFPIWLLALGPIVWGVPHVLSDVRYLVVRPGLHRRWPLWLAAGVPLFVLTFTLQTSWGLVAAAGAALVARGSVARKLAVATPIACLALLASRDWFFAAVIFAHAHNVIGVALWWAWRGRERAMHLLPLAAFVLGNALLLSGALDPVLFASGGLAHVAGGMDLYYHIGSLAPDALGALGPRLVLSFAFSQSVHYVIWVRMVPDEDRRRETPRTFASTLRALRADFGWPLVALAVLFAIGLAVWAAIDLFAARTGYLRAVLFHGHLEVAAAAVFLVEGLRPSRATEAAPA